MGKRRTYKKRYARKYSRKRPIKRQIKRTRNNRRNIRHRTRQARKHIYKRGGMQAALRQRDKRVTSAKRATRRMHHGADNFSELTKTLTRKNTKKDPAQAQLEQEQIKQRRRESDEARLANLAHSANQRTERVDNLEKRQRAAAEQRRVMETEHRAAAKHAEKVSANRNAAKILKQGKQSSDIVGKHMEKTEAIIDDVDNMLAAMEAAQVGREEEEKHIIFFENLKRKLRSKEISQDAFLSFANKYQQMYPNAEVPTDVLDINAAIEADKVQKRLNQVADVFSERSRIEASRAQEPQKRNSSGLLKRTGKFFGIRR